MTDRSELGLRAAVPLVMAVFSLLLLAASMSIGNPLDQPLGPGLVPEILSLCILAGAAWEAWVSLRRLRRSGRASSCSAPPTTVPPASLVPGNLFRGERRWLAAALLLLLGVEVWHLAGYFVGMLICVAMLFWMDRQTRPVPAVLFSVGLVGLMWFLFDQLLHVSLS
ncbi:MAG TPA: tripartite tricarboxylate transporter TctB family protein [Bacillota bacterium]